MQKLVQFNKALQKFLNSLNAVLLVVTVAVILLQTFCRFVLNNSPSFTEELTRYTFIALIFLGISVSIENDGFVRMELFDAKLPAWGLKALNFLRYALPVFICAVMAWQSVAFVRMGALRKSQALPVSMAVPYGIILGGYVLSLFSGIIRFYEFLKGRS